ncbi:GNAT family N-acetyltransferase [Streptomyces sp. NPDC059556]|uniref:GNAT family N-acetyltransferase n=1 Tax=Streptomyces sp. NPDC059556 TaxID=3346863 RepID=UPI0036C12BB8
MIVPKTLIRTAERADDAVLAELDRAAWSPLHAVLPAPEPPYEPFFDERHNPGDYLLAVREEEVVGYIRVVPPTRLAATAHVRQIQGLVVAEAARAPGGGGARGRAAMHSAGAAGAAPMTLRVLGHNAPARALYASEGFAVEGVLPGEMFLAGEYVDDVLMGRSLTLR